MAQNIQDQANAIPDCTCDPASSVRGRLCTRTFYTGTVTIDPSSPRGTQLDFEVDEEPEHPVAHLRLGSIPSANPLERRYVSLISNVWFKQGSIDYFVDGQRLDSHQFYPQMGRSVGVAFCGDPQMQFASQLPLGQGEVEVMLTLVHVDHLDATEDGKLKGRGKRFTWPRHGFKKSSLLDKLEEGYKSMDFADLKLVCQGREFKCHKFMLAAVSPVIKGFLTNNCREAQEGVIVIEDAEPSAVELFLHYVYFEDLSAIDVKSENLEDELSQLLHLAEKYDVPSLKEECCELLICCLDKENASEILRLARVLSIPDLEATAQKYIVYKVKDVIKTDSWKELLSVDPNVANNIIQQLIQKNETSRK